MSICKEIGKEDGCCATTSRKPLNPCEDMAPPENGVVAAASSYLRWSSKAYHVASHFPCVTLMSTANVSVWFSSYQ